MRNENWPRHLGSMDCGCARCRRSNRAVERLANASLSAALSHAQDRMEADWQMEAETPAGAITLPGRFGGWKDATTLDDVLGPQAPIAFSAGKPRRLYRIYEEGSRTPLYIGMALNASIQSRVAEHMKGIFTKSGQVAKTAPIKQLLAKTASDLVKSRSEITKLRILAAQLGLSKRIKIQHAEVTPNRGYILDAKFLHAFESALQILEKPHSYVGSSRTFELESDFAMSDLSVGV
jgi:hypothetical protein